jgi:RNA polymerase sigma-70 factor (ECF subfamily)
LVSSDCTGPGENPGVDRSFVPFTLNQRFFNQGCILNLFDQEKLMTGWSVTNATPKETQDSDVALVLSVQKDPAAFAELYEKYALGVYRYIFSRVGQPEGAEDLTAQVFLEALEHVDSYRPVGTFAAWLFTIARRRSADFFRKLRPMMSLEEDSACDPSDPLSNVIQDEELHLLDEQLRALDEPEREILRLRFAARLSFADIGALLGKNPAAIKTATYRLLDRMERNMEESYDRKS